MSKLTTKKFWTHTAERAVKTAAQVAIATIGTAVILSEVSWLAVGSASALGALLSVLTSIATLDGEGQPSFTD